jgi:hypothetical protein
MGLTFSVGNPSGVFILDDAERVRASGWTSFS